MTTKHTPAPWFVNTQPDITGDVWATSPAGIRQFIAVCPDVHFLGREETHRQWRVNARLIAAAPELLAALIGAQSALRKALPFLPPDSEALYVGEWLDEASAAITKATA